MNNIVGIDLGTMNLVSAKQIAKDKVEFNTMRNMFLPISPNMLATHELAEVDLDYAISKDEEGETDKIYILGEDAFRFSQIFGKPVNRPMSQGVISSKEVDSIDVLTLMIKKLIGGISAGHIIYSVPAAAIDEEVPPVLYHERVFGRIFNTLGFTSSPINEGMAIIYSECKASNYSGISFSFGSGLTNICCAYKGTPTLSFAVSRGGDWIDKETSLSTAQIASRITSIKEKDLSLIESFKGKKKEKLVREALTFYYSALVEYVLHAVINRFELSSGGLEIQEKLPIIISGGTSLALGFVELFEKKFSEFKAFPYEISGIRHASDPLNAVAKGSLIYGISQQRRKIEKGRKG